LKKIGVDVTQGDPKLIGAVKSRQSKARTLVEMAESVAFYFADDNTIEYEKKAAARFLNPENRVHLEALSSALSTVAQWSEETAHATTHQFCEANGIKLKDVAQPCRVALTGSKTGPGLFEMMAVLGRNSTCNRLNRAAGK
jgi:glutamyl-tRNA synthetase